MFVSQVSGHVTSLCSFFQEIQALLVPKNSRLGKRIKVYVWSWII